MIEFYDRTAYSLFVMEIPHVRGNELTSAVKIKLNSLYPGNISDCNIQIKKNGSKKWSYLVFVLNKNTGNKMLTLSPLFIQCLYIRKTSNVLYAGKNWLDYVRIENGAVISSTVKIRDETSLLGDIKNMLGPEKDLDIYCDESDKKYLIPLNESHNVKFYDNYTETRKIDVHKMSLFNEKSPVIIRQRVLAAAAIVFLFMLGTWLSIQYNRNEKERNAQHRLDQEQQHNETVERQRENQRLIELKNRYQEIITAKTASPFDIAAVIAECAGTQTRIISATFNGNFFQIEGITGSSLGLLGNFEKHRLVSGVRLHQVHPSFNTDTFTLSGTIQPEIFPVNESLPVNEQIVILETLISEETNHAMSNSYSSPSAFGEAVNSLFMRWNCTVSSYQFMSETQGTEVELLLRGSPNGFFSALYEIKTRHRLWDIRLTQIRNLYPRDMLEVLIRIRTIYSPSSNGIADAVPERNYDPYPVSSISRNYFAPAAVIPAASVITREPAPVVTPARAERVSWLEYVGSVRDDNDIRYIYLKNTRTGAIIKLGNFSEGNMRYVTGQGGGIIAYIDDNIYEITGR